MHRVVLIAFLLLATGTWAQTHADLENRAPVLIHKTQAQYTQAARQAALEGAVFLYVEIGIDGRAHNIRVIRRLGLGLDEKAIDAVSHWRFLHGLKNGKPVVAPATVEVIFRLDNSRDVSNYI